MSEQAQYQRAPLGEWHALMFRLTVFPVPSATPHTFAQWESVVGLPPETTTAQPRLGVSVEQGPLGSGILTLDVNPITLEWRLTPAEDVEGQISSLPAEGTFPSVGSFDRALAVFLELMLKWL